MTTLEATDALQERIRQAPLALIAGRIKRARREFGSHDALVDAMGESSRQHLIKLEQGKHRPRAEYLLKIMAATGKSEDFFLDESAIENPFPEAA